MFVSVLAVKALDFLVDFSAGVFERITDVVDALAGGPECFIVQGLKALFPILMVFLYHVLHRCHS